MSELSDIKSLLNQQFDVMQSFNLKLNDQTEAIHEQNEKINEIHFAIFGNERAGVRGIANTVVDHGKTISEYKRLKWMGLGISFVTGGGIVAWLKNHLGL